MIPNRFNVDQNGPEFSLKLNNCFYPFQFRTTVAKAAEDSDAFELEEWAIERCFTIHDGLTFKFYCFEDASY